jgi:DUF971 family protein
VESAHHVPKAQGIQVNWLDGHASVFNATWLRVNCPVNVHPSGQRLSSPGDVLEVTPVRVEPGPNKDGMHVKWSDGHESVYCSKWLRLHDSSVSSIIDRNQGSWPVALRSWEAIPKVIYTRKYPFSGYDEELHEKFLLCHGFVLYATYIWVLMCT